jgi:2-polyprenyl-3-methyl-5-hydroxy-6-metoxy-1,4-benzoquinol methylase
MSCCEGVNQMFGDRTAAHDLRRYHKRGPSKPTRILLAALHERGIANATVLDIGGGVGTIQQELLASGVQRVTSVEASTAYLRAAQQEARRRGTEDRVTHWQGDFVQLAGEIEPADVVTLDRVICCYPDMPALVGRSAAKTRRLYGLVFPRDTWWTKLGFGLCNVALRLARRRFQAHIHRTGDVHAVAREHGLALELHRTTGPVWQVALYARAPSRQ